MEWNPVAVSYTKLYRKYGSKHDEKMNNLDLRDGTLH
jgi:hypothetical protein